MQRKNTISSILNNKFSTSNYFSHVSLCNPCGKFQLDIKSQETIFEYFEKTPPPYDFGLAENPGDFIPVIADIDIKTKFSGDLFSLYTNEDVLKIIDIYQNVLRELDTAGINDKMLNCVFLAKNPYVDSANMLKHGFHLHFPSIFLHKSVHKIYILPKVRERVAAAEFSTMNISTDSVDSGYYRSTWLMYGCVKSIDREPYLLDTIYDANLKPISFDNAFKDYELFDLDGKVIAPAKSCLGRILSIFANGRKCLDVIIEDYDKAEFKKKFLDNKSPNPGKLKTAIELLPFLNCARAQDRNDWMTVGWALYNISNGSKEGLDAWISFSERGGEKYDEAVCIDEWDRMVRKNVTIGTIKYFANLDSPKEYEEFNRKQIFERRSNLVFSHVAMAKILHNNFSGVLVCAALTPNEKWFIFENDIWKKSDRGHIIMDKITTFLVPLFENMRDDIYSLRKTAFDELGSIEKESGIGSIEYANQLQKAMDFKKEIDDVSKLLLSLETRPFRINIRGECSELFYDSEFYSKLNSDPYLFAFKNGIYDFHLDEFRKGKPEDYISKRAGVEFIRDISPHKEYVERMEDYLSKVFLDDDVRRYFMDYCCELFVGGNHDKLFMIWSGLHGDNAKSMTIKILETIFKDDSYFVNMSIQVILGKRSGSGKANPDLARCGDGVRIVVTQEPGSGTTEQINVGLMKELTGNDTFYARLLYENGRDVTPMFKFIMVCNTPPKISNIDNASRERIRILPFESRFVKPEKAPKTIEEQREIRTFPRDPYFSNYVPELARVFAWMLIQHRIEKHKSGRGDEVPEKVRDASDAYGDRNDIYKIFFTTYVVKNNESSIHIEEIYRLFVEWSESSFRGRKIVDKYDFADIMCAYTGNHERYTWKGYEISLTGAAPAI
jgi:hypothetical protein